jgi:glutathione synthase/RimK-type ligase-like ATP-grasp enzyme
LETYDFGRGWIEDGQEYLFKNSLRTECTARGLRLLLVDGDSLREVSESVEKGKIRLGFFLDLASEITDSNDEFAKFVYRLKDSGTRVVADPDRVRSALDKSITHYTLTDAEITVPYTVVVRNWEPTRRLTDYERGGLGLPFVIKPASGYGQRGVKVIEDWMSLKEIAEARSFDPGDNFLLQAFIKPRQLDGSPAWFRVFFVFGEVMICWWNPKTGIYRQTTLREFERYRLSPVARITSEIAARTGIEWFSCEIALNEKTGKFTVIDYMNDQFDVSSQTQRDAGVPDDLVLLFVQRLAEKAWQYKIGRHPLSYRAIWFPRMKVGDEGI